MEIFPSSNEVVPLNASRWHCVLRLGKAKPAEGRRWCQYCKISFQEASASRPHPSFCKPKFCPHPSVTSGQSDLEPVPCSLCEGLHRMDSRVPSSKVLPTLGVHTSRTSLPLAQLQWAQAHGENAPGGTDRGSQQGAVSGPMQRTHLGR